jgi:hypothetical protein
MSMANGAEGAIELAGRRLERAVALLEQRIAQKLALASAGAGTAFDEDRARLAAALDDARARERELEDAGAAASAALARAISEIRATLGAAPAGSPSAGAVKVSEHQEA